MGQVEEGGGAGRGGGGTGRRWVGQKSMPTMRV